MTVAAIIPARGGSKGLPRKNLLELCGKPLLAWSIEQARGAGTIDQVWVSSDSEEILEVATRYGARPIRRPDALAGDDASSEAAWLHAVDEIERSGASIDLVVGMQATSPLREPQDLDNALRDFQEQRCDSMLSCSEIKDYFVWKRGSGGQPVSVSYDYRNRLPRQAIEQHYLENGSFYIFTPDLLRRTGNRLGGRIGLYAMERYKMFQIDTEDDVLLCQAIMRAYGLAS
ncbi:MAG: cytidylyltransferase domain-containing protein [bacterium]